MNRLITWLPIFAVIMALWPLTTKSANNLSKSPASLGWLEKSFSGNTRYTLEAIDNTQAVKGHTVGSASALYRHEKIDVSSTPILSWRWKVSNVFENTQEKQKSGDDFPARLYVVYQKGFFKWSTVAINYVWSSQYPVGESWSSAYTSKSKIVVLQSGSPTQEGWVNEKRNIVDDFKRFFDIDVSRLDGYALMVDGDNTGGSATGWFADITFSKE